MILFTRTYTRTLSMMLIGSGEIDSLEMCPRDNIFLNFAGGGHQVPAGFSIDNSSGHVTVRKDTAGIVTITSCTDAEAASNGGQCLAPVYSGCTDCLASSQECVPTAVVPLSACCCLIWARKY